MSPRTKREDDWIKQAHLEVAADADTDDANWHYTGRVIFPNVPLGKGDFAEVAVTSATNTNGEHVITDIGMNVPINTRRLKALPWDAISRRCTQVWSEADAAVSLYLTRIVSPKPPDELDEAIQQLRIAYAGDRRSDDFLAAIATVSRLARERGRSGPKTVWESLQQKGSGPTQRTVHRYIAKAQERFEDAANRKEAERFFTGEFTRDDRVYAIDPPPVVPPKMTSRTSRKKG